jgi:hypothetical protein
VQGVRDWRERRRAAGLAAASLVWVVLVLAACGGGGGGTTSASTAATSRGPAPTAAHGSKGDKPTRPHITRKSAALHRAALRLSASARRGRRVGGKLCAGVKREDALAHFLAAAKAAEKQHHISGRAGMIARIKRLPKRAYKGKAAPAMAAALVASGMPPKQRVGAFTGCLRQLQRNG